MNNSIKQFTDLPESKTLEFKRDLTSPVNIIRTIVAFANSAGGTLIVGVDDDKSIIGVEKPLAEEERLSSIIADNIVPAISPDISLSSVDDRTVMIVTVYPSQRTPHFYKKLGISKGTYLRLGSTNRIADNTQIAELERNTLKLHFDQEINRSATIDDLDLDKIKETISDKKRFHSKTLENSEIVKIEQGVKRPTNGGLILFAKEVRSFFPDAWVQCGRFQGKTRADIVDHTEIYEQPLDAIDKILEYVKKHAFRGLSIHGSDRVDVWNVPLVACRELIANALIHTDYSVRGMNIRVAIYDDRIEIESPGGLVAGMTTDEMMSGRSKPRNPMIAQIFQDVGKGEKWGSGIPRALKEIKEYRLPTPIFQEVAGRTIATIFVKINKQKKDSFYNNSDNDDEFMLSDRVPESARNFYEPVRKIDRPVRNVSELILRYVRKNNVITANIVADLIDVSDRTARRKLNALVAEGKLKEEGSTKARVYKNV